MENERLLTEDESDGLDAISLLEFQDRKIRRETARQIFDWCEDKWIKEFPNRGKLEDYIEWIKLKSRFLKES